MRRSAAQLTIAGAIVVLVAVGISSAAVRASGSTHGSSPSGTPSAIGTTSSSTGTPTPSSSTPTSTLSTPAGTPTPTPSSTPTPAATGSKASMPPITYVVKPGDNLYDIARWFHLHGYGGLYEANRAVIGNNPRLIVPGQRITIANGVMTLSAP